MLMSKDQKTMDRYILQKDIPGCKAGALFVHDKEDKIYGSVAEGCLKLAWTDNGNTQPETNTKTAIGLCAETIVFHISVVRNEEWFIKENKHKSSYLKEKLTEKVRELLNILESN